MLVEIEFELNREMPRRNKALLAIIELVGLGVFGVDRCYTGQMCIGVIKGLTFGGFAVWAILDYIGVAITCLSFSHTLNVLGMRAVFESSGWNAVAFMLIIVLWPVMCYKGFSMIFGASSKPSRHEQDGGA